MRKFILVFFDDILIFSKTWNEHLSHLKLTLQLLQKHSLFAKTSKYVFAKQEIEYLGHLVSDKGVSADASKLEAMANWPIPNTLK